MGLDQSLPQQYVIWFGRMLHGNLGKSLLSHLPVSTLLAQRIPATMELALAAMLFAVVVSLVLGVLAAVYERRPLDWIISVFNSLSIAVPGFWLGILLILLFSVRFSWLPPGGRVADWRQLGPSVRALVLPTLALAMPLVGTLSRFVKSAMLEVLYDDFVRTARSKGLAPRVVLFGHALRNALLPVITVLGLQFGFLLGGAVIIESVFSWPGLGAMMLDGIGNRDYAVVQAGLLYLGGAFIMLNLLTDLTYGLLNPRIRFGDGG
jgi:peptide/nickel transport system permease protein